MIVRCFAHVSHLELLASPTTLPIRPTQFDRKIQPKPLRCAVRFSMITTEGQKKSRGNCRQTGAEPESLKAYPQFPASFVRKSIKRSMGAMIAWNRLPQIVRPARIFRLRCLLPTKTGLSQIAIERFRRKFVRHDRFDSGPTNVQFATPVV